jgi:Holliday junction resolvase RusA-like endonuclease
MTLNLAPPLLDLPQVVAITVLGIPAPQGSKAYKGQRTNKSTGRAHAVLVESSKKVKPWRGAVESAARLAIADLGPWEPLDGPLVAEMVFTLPKPASAPKRRQTWPIRYPDISKLARSTEDALTTAGVWADDARVVEYQRLAKVFPGEGLNALDTPGAVIRVWRLS